MIEIKKVTDIPLAKRICASHELKWDPSYHVIATIEGEKILQSAVFSYNDEVGKIHAIHGFDDNMDLLDGLCRAILNIMDINGVKDVYLSEKQEKLAKKIGFIKEKEQYQLSLEGFFQCGCCKK